MAEQDCGRVYMFELENHPDFRGKVIHKFGWSGRLHRREKEITPRSRFDVSGQITAWYPGTKVDEKKLQDAFRRYKIPRWKAEQAALPAPTEWFLFRSAYQARIAFSSEGFWSACDDWSLQFAELCYLRSKIIARYNRGVYDAAVRVMADIFPMQFHLAEEWGLDGESLVAALRCLILDLENHI